MQEMGLRDHVVLTEVTWDSYHHSDSQVYDDHDLETFQINPAVTALHVQPFNFVAKPNPCSHNWFNSEEGYYRKDEIKRGTDV
jgi:hypothetical protein